MAVGLVTAKTYVTGGNCATVSRVSAVPVLFFVVAGRSRAAGTITAKIISPNARIMPRGKEREVP